MYQNSNFKHDIDGNFSLVTPAQRPLKILQLTDMHLGFGTLSKKADKMATDAVSELVERSKPDLIMLTGDSIFPFWPRAGTANNIKQAQSLLKFFDSFKTPYALMFGNHDVEMGSKADKDELAEIFKSGEYSIFTQGPERIYGVGNYLIKLTSEDGAPHSALAVLDSNMYGDGWFFSGFDCIHADQTQWCMEALEGLQRQNPDLSALCFFHIPLAEYKQAYEKMRLGDKSVTYHFGTIGEPNDYFGISKYPCDFFDRAKESGIIKGIFCGHDHYNNLSVTYEGIRLTYGMSIDCLGYMGIKKRYTQRGGTVIEVSRDGSFEVSPLPLSSVVSNRIRGIKEDKEKSLI